MENDVMEEYKSCLSDLNCNSKPMINALTIIAEENIKYASQVVQVIENHINTAAPDLKLPVLYLIDSIMKNVGRDYLNPFSERIAPIFTSVFEKVDERTRVLLLKLRQSWEEMISSNSLYAIDFSVKQMDSAWPIASHPPANKSTESTIHINPKFLAGSVKQNESLKRRIEDLEGLLEQERDQHHTAMQSKEKELNLRREGMEEELNLLREDMEEELNLLREDKEKQLQEYQDLLDIKLALDKEIEAFRKVLEVQGTRLNITPTKSPLADVQQSTPAQCAPVRGAKRKHTVLHTEEGSTDDSQVSSAAKGDIEVNEHDQEGKYVKPFKKGNTVPLFCQNLGSSEEI